MGGCSKWASGLAFERHCRVQAQQQDIGISDVDEPEFGY
jgi:hypothetical protein